MLNAEGHLIQRAHEHHQEKAQLTNQATEALAMEQTRAAEAEARAQEAEKYASEMRAQCEAIDKEAHEQLALANSAAMIEQERLNKEVEEKKENWQREKDTLIAQMKSLKLENKQLSHKREVDVQGLQG